MAIPGMKLNTINASMIIFAFGIYNLARAYPPSSETMVVTATDTTVTNTLFPKYVPSFHTLHAFA